MRRTVRSFVGGLAALALLVSTTPGAAGLGAGRIEGLLLGLDGRPAAGFRVHAVDEAGRDRAAGEVREDGLYTLVELPAGEYALAVERPGGTFAPVAAAPVRLGAGSLERRDIKLMQAEPDERDAAVASSGGLGAWWAGLSTPAKIWVVVGSLVVIGITYVAITDDNDEEPPASPD